jgi:hypothetical protein
MPYVLRPLGSHASVKERYELESYVRRVIREGQDPTRVVDSYIVLEMTLKLLSIPSQDTASGTPR